MTDAELPEAAPALRIGVATIFPEIVTQYAEQSVLARAQRKGVVAISVVDLRDGATDPMGEGRV